MSAAPNMNRRTFLSLSSAALAVAGAPAFAGYDDQVTKQLRKQGFKDISVSSTLLGRTRIVARRKDGVREIILNPRTGEILRDMWTANGGSGGPKIAGDDDNGPSKGTGGNDDNGGSDDGGNDDNGGGDDGGNDDNGGNDDGGDKNDDSNDGNSGGNDDKEDDKDEDKSDDKEDDGGDKEDKSDD